MSQQCIQSRVYSGIFQENKVSWIYLLKPNYSQTLKIHKGFQDLGLSTAETELSTLLFDGKSLNDISEQRHVSKQTVRKQLQSVLRKTNCDSQENLMIFFIRKLHSLSLNKNRIMNTTEQVWLALKWLKMGLSGRWYIYL